MFNFIVVKWRCLVIMYINIVFCLFLLFLIYVLYVVWYIWVLFLYKYEVINVVDEVFN